MTPQELQDVRNHLPVLFHCCDHSARGMTFVPTLQLSEEQVAFMAARVRMQLPAPRFLQCQAGPDRWLIAAVSRDPAGPDGRLKWHLSLSSSIRSPPQHVSDRQPNPEERDAAILQLLPPGIRLEIGFGTGNVIEVWEE